jgi:hypothetical protein
MFKDCDLLGGEMENWALSFMPSHQLILYEGTTSDIVLGTPKIENAKSSEIENTKIENPTIGLKLHPIYTTGVPSILLKDGIILLGGVSLDKLNFAIILDGTGVPLDDNGVPLGGTVTQPGLRISPSYEEDLEMFANILSSFIIKNNTTEALDVITYAYNEGITLTELMKKITKRTIFEYNSLPINGFLSMALYGNQNTFKMFESLDVNIFNFKVSQSIIFNIIQNKNQDAFDFLIEKHGIGLLDLSGLKLNRIAKNAGLLKTL